MGLMRLLAGQLHNTPRREIDTMQITINIRNVYGANKVYPVCDRAKAIANIAGTKTLTSRVLLEVLALGFDIQVMGIADCVIRAKDDGHTNSLTRLAIASA